MNITNPCDLKVWIFGHKENIIECDDSKMMHTPEMTFTHAEIVAHMWGIERGIERMYFLGTAQ